MNRAAENTLVYGGGTQIGYQIVEVMTQVWTDLFTSVPALEPLCLSVVTLSLSVPVSQALAVRGRNKNKGR